MAAVGAASTETAVAARARGPSPPPAIRWVKIPSAATSQRARGRSTEVGDWGRDVPAPLSFAPPPRRRQRAGEWAERSKCLSRLRERPDRLPGGLCSPLAHPLLFSLRDEQPGRRQAGPWRSNR